jgi:hypothetical protein
MPPPRSAAIGGWSHEERAYIGRILDEDISVASLVAGQPSSEGAASLQRWLAARKA